MIGRRGKVCVFVPEDHEARIVNGAVATFDLSPLFTRCEGGGAEARWESCRECSVRE